MVSEKCFFSFLMLQICFLYYFLMCSFQVKLIFTGICCAELYAAAAKYTSYSCNYADSGQYRKLFSPLSESLYMRKSF